MPWKEKSCVDLRVELVQRTLDGESVSELCKEYGVSRTIAHKWIRRFNDEQRIGALCDRSRRPHISPTKLEAGLEARICELRSKYGWGGKKLRVLLQREGKDVPVITIDRVIKRNGLIATEDKHRPALKRFQRPNPNELWQTDFKGPMGVGSVCCEPLSVVDDHSRYVIGLKAVVSKQTSDVKQAFEEIFEEYGVPDAILLDHGVPWWSVSHLFGLSKFSVWLMKQDLRLIFSGINHPQTQGKVERFHGSLESSVRTKGVPESFSGWQPLLSEIKEEFNYVRPHEALNMKVPGEFYIKSRKKFIRNPKIPSYPDGSTVVRVDEQGRFSFGQRRFFACHALANEYIRLEELDSSLAIYYRNSIVREVSLETGKSSFVLP